ncbi:hypothetical protein BD410DRAFT_760816 [Rickenella mellea]|uniref:BTB domain-containing protein n=1 Tax=Rickenella mellea TaxID=50990 RepID=A0A4Y7QJ73_9AGAM|nr:hypothetical protein BD410DRAFT_760816 [Rickenella mellea]
MYHFGSLDFAPSSSNTNSELDGRTGAPHPFIPELSLPEYVPTLESLRKEVAQLPSSTPAQLVLAEPSTVEPKRRKDPVKLSPLCQGGSPSFSPSSARSPRPEDSELRDSVTKLIQKIEEANKQAGNPPFSHLNGDTQNCEQPAVDDKVMELVENRNFGPDVDLHQSPLESHSTQDTHHCVASVVPDGQQAPVPAQEAVTSPLTSVDFKPHPNYWYHDGSVVIMVEEQLFRVHRSFLERKSVFFGRLFKRESDRIPISFPKVNCPIHRVNGRAEDFTRLLDALDDGLAFATNPLSFSSLASVLRASTALEFHDLRAFVLQKFEKMWPDSFDAVTRVRRPHALESIVLAKECNVPKVLKPAMYELLRTPTLDFNSIVKRDGKENNQCLKAPKHLPLQPTDITNLIIAREKLVSEWVSIAAIRPEYLPCHLWCIPTEKQDAAWSILVHKSRLFCDGMYDPICGLAAMVGFPNWAKHGWCEGCITRNQSVWKAKRAELWSKLDEWLALA